MNKATQTQVKQAFTDLLTHKLCLPAFLYKLEIGENDGNWCVIVATSPQGAKIIAEAFASNGVAFNQWELEVNA